MFARLKPFEDRPGAEHSVQAVLGAHQRAALRHPGRDRRRLHAAGDPGLEPVRRVRVPGAGSERRRHHRSLASATQAIVGAGNQSPSFGRGLFSSFTANDPQLQVDDRPRARAGARAAARRDHERDADLSRLAVRERFRVQQPRVSRVRAGRSAVPVQPAGAAAALRAHAAAARWCRSSRSCASRKTTAPQVISHFNLFRSATINGSAAPGVSSGEALAEMERLAEANLPEGHGLRVVGHFARRDQGRPPVVPDLRPRAAARLPDAGGAVRKPRPAVHRAARRAARRARRARRAVVARLCQRRLLPGRPRHAGRAGGKERHPDRRVRRAAPRSRHDRRRGGHRGGAHPAPADPDDVAGVHPRRPAARVRDRRRPGGAAFGRNGRRGRHVRVDVPQPPLHPGALRRGPDHPRRGGAGGHAATTGDEPAEHRRFLVSLLLDCAASWPVIS